MDRNGRVWEKSKAMLLSKIWRPTKWILLVLLVFLLLFLLMLIIETAVWQLLDLLIVPVVLALGAWFLNKKQKETELEIAQKQREEDARIAQEKNQTDRLIAKDRNQQTLLDGYFDRMTSLILEKGLKESVSGDEIRNIARTHTLSVLRNLDGKRKGQVLRFLYESNLVGKIATIELHAAEFRQTDLIMVPLSLFRDENGKTPNEWSEELITQFVMKDYDSFPHNVTKAWSSSLWQAELKDVDFSSSAFILTKFGYANLDEANFTGAILALANFEGANLRGASLQDADLRRANLSKAKVTNEQLQTAKSLEGAIMPNGEKYHPEYFKKAK